LDLFINNSLNHVSIRSRLVSQPKNKLISNNEQLFNATDLSPITFGIISSPKPRGKNSTNSQINPGSSDENKNSKVRTIKILLDSGASASIVRKDVLHVRHKILKDKKNKWSTMAGTFNTTSVTEIMLKLPELNHSAEIYAKCHLTDNLLNYDLILGRDILHELGIIFNFENKTITWQEVSISMKPPNCTAKEFFVIKESRPVRNATKRIKQILDTEYKKIDLKSIITNSNYLKDKHRNSLLELLQKYKNMFDGTLGKYTGSDYVIELKEDAKPYHAKPFPIPKHSRTNS